MPQVDLSSVCSTGGAKQVACETTIAGDNVTAPPDDQPQQQHHLDYAPESFWLSEDAELDWLDRNAFMERKDSGKSHSTNPNPNPVHPSAGSNRYSVNSKSKPSIIGLPKATKPNYVDAKNRRHCKAASIRLFPKRSGSVGSKSGPALSEPGSPKVSCMGRVRSRKDRKNVKNRRKGSEPGILVRNKSVKERKPGFWNNFRSIFRHKSGHNNNNNNNNNNKTEDNGDEPELNSVGKKKRGFNLKTGVDGLSGVEPPGLGGVKRFASGRRSDGWTSEFIIEAGKSEPLNDNNKGPIWLRREGAPHDVEVVRDWHAAGPASV